MHADFTVIGSGMSGLTAALLLARHGRSVVLVERYRKPAPILRGFKRQGVYFDTGFHYAGSLGRGEILDRYFRYLGLTRHLRTAPLEPEAFDVLRYLDPAFEFGFPCGEERVRKAFGRAFPAEREGMDRYLEAVRAAFTSSPFLNMDLEYGPRFAFPDMDDSTLGDVLRRHFSDETCRSLLGVHCLLHGSAPSEVPFTMHARVIGSYFETVCALEGGGRSLVNACLAELERLGVPVLCGREAVALEASDGELTGVRLEDGEVISCKGCIATLHPSKLAPMLPQGIFRQSYLRRLTGLEETSSAYMVFGRLDNPPASLLGRNFFILPRRDIDSYFQTETPLLERPIYIAANTSGDPDRKRAGVVILSRAFPSEVEAWTGSRLGARPREYVEFKRGIMARIQELAERHCPELSGMTLLEGATPLTFRDYENTPMGGLYGAKHTVSQSNPLSRTKLKGLYLAGQSIVAPGVLGALISAVVACGNVLGVETILQGLRECA